MKCAASSREVSALGQVGAHENLGQDDHQKCNGEGGKCLDAGVRNGLGPRRELRCRYKSVGAGATHASN